MKKLSLVLACVGFVLFGCNGAKQDPLASKNDAIKNGQFPVQKVQTPVAEESQVIRIESADQVTFIEGRGDQITITPRVLLKESEYTAEMQITNMEDFKDAQFDSATGVFTWTPPKGYIFGGLRKEMDMVVRVYVRFERDGKQRIFTQAKTIKVAVEKSMGLPVIVKVEGVPGAFKEADTYDISVVVRDEDAGATQDTFPRLVFGGPNYGSFSFAPFIKINRIEPNFASREFTYRLTVDFDDTYLALTDEYTSAGFSIKAISRYDIQSSTSFIDNKIVATLGKLKASWNNEIQFQPGQVLNYSFVIYEESSRADFNVENLELPTGARIECDTINAKGIIPCTLAWKVKPDEPLGIGVMSIKVTGLKKYQPEVTPVEETFTFKYRVIRPPPVAPASIIAPTSKMKSAGAK